MYLIVIAAIIATVFPQLGVPLFFLFIIAGMLDTLS